MSNPSTSSGTDDVDAGLIDGLRARWDDLTSFVSTPVKERWWTAIRDNHSRRAFHNLRRLAERMRLYDEFKDQLKDRYAVAMAMFFKHLEYDPALAATADDGGASQNVERFHEFCAGTTFDQENYVATLLAESGKNCTEAHLTPGVYGDEDVHYFIDFDTAWLGAPPGEYDRYSAAERLEFPTTNEERAKMLELFLQVPNIFATRPFRDRYETVARANIQREIESIRRC